jgi:hypothetical protein
LRHCATSRKVAGSIPDVVVVGIFHWYNSSGCIMALGLTQPLTEMSTRSKGGRCIALITLPPSCADYLENWEPQGLSRFVMGLLYLFYLSTLLAHYESAFPFLIYTTLRPLVLQTSVLLTLSDPTSNLVRQCDFPVPLRCRKTSDAVFVAFVRPLSEPLRRFSSCSTDFSQQIAQVVLFLFLCDFLF